MTDKTKARRALEKQRDALQKLLDLAATAETAPNKPVKRKGRKS